MRPHRGIKVFKVQVESEPCWRNEWSRGVEKVRVSYSGEWDQASLFEINYVN